MKSSKLLLLGTVLALTMSFTTCSDEDEIPNDPVGTITLNMQNESNGQTLLGNSDVYIDDANNFYSPSCLLSSLGKKNGLGSVSGMLLMGGTNTAAVEPGNAYQVFNGSTIKEFPSGKLALSIGSSYYNVYVVSQIKQGDAIIGANVKFILMDTPDNGLPSMNTNIGTIDHLDANKHAITIELPTSDFEYEPAFNNLFNVYEHEKSGNKLTIRLIEYYMPRDFGFYIRIKDTFTYVYGNVR